MQRNEHRRELTGRAAASRESYAWMRGFGTPSATAPWGGPRDGHHLRVNGFVRGDPLVMTPTCRDAAPVTAAFGTYAGARVLPADEAQGCARRRARTPAHQRQARLGLERPGAGRTRGFRDQVAIIQGLSSSELSSAPPGLRVRRMATSVGRLQPDHAEIRRAAVPPQVSDPACAWSGPGDEGRPC
jgi:Protein of unknown function (DUF3500)